MLIASDGNSSPAGSMPIVQRGTTLIEVLVTIVILTIGLLGLAGLQGQIFVAEIESYQRAQAVLLMNDMVDRMTSNRSQASLYSTATAADCTSTIAAKDRCEWNSELAGSSEKTSASVNAGAMVGARGCIELVTAEAPGSCIAGVYRVTVVWQGANLTTAPPAAVTCGQGLYGDERYRRAVYTNLAVGLPSC